MWLLADHGRLILLHPDLSHMNENNEHLNENLNVDL